MRFFSFCSSFVLVFLGISVPGGSIRRALSIPRADNRKLLVLAVLLFFNLHPNSL
jgi:hypothetical protein